MATLNHILLIPSFILVVFAEKIKIKAILLQKMQILCFGSVQINNLITL